MSEHSDAVQANAGQKRPGALHRGPRKKPYVPISESGSFVNMRSNSCGTDPLVHHGRHFGRTVHAFCTMSTLLNNGILRLRGPPEQSDASLTNECIMITYFHDPKLTHIRERREHMVFQTLLQMIPGIEERLLEGSDENTLHIAELVRPFRF